MDEKISIDEFYMIFQNDFPGAKFEITGIKGINGKIQAFLLHGFSMDEEDCLVGES